MQVRIYDLQYLSIYLAHLSLHIHLSDLSCTLSQLPSATVLTLSKRTLLRTRAVASALTASQDSTDFPGPRAG